MVLRFAGFELDQERAELRGRDGAAIKLRPKPFAMLRLLALNTGRVVTKQELMEGVWPNIHVGEDSLFQCIRDIRSALGDEQRQLIKVISGRGYLFDAEVSDAPADAAAPPTQDTPQQGWPPFRLRGRAVVAGLIGLCAVIGVAVATPFLMPDLIFQRQPPAIAVLPIVNADRDPRTASVAENVTDRLTDGLARIENIRVVATSSSARGAPAHSTRPDFLVSAELHREAAGWTMEARMSDVSTGEVKWSGSVSVPIETGDLSLQQSRLGAKLGHELAVRINALLHSSRRTRDGGTREGAAKVVVEQALSSINQTSRERFAAAQTMLEKALADMPGNVDLQVALAGLQTRGIQMIWYDPSESAAAESTARSLLESALKAEPGYLPVLEAYCRFLTATNNFVESLVACARALRFDPWNGSVLYQYGLTQLQLGRFEDALATFRQADRFDTPDVSRWTWLLGIGWANLFLGNNEDAVSWLERSIAITPASGRPYLLLAVAHHRLGRTDEAKAALAKAMALRPGSTAANIPSPTRNASPVFIEALGGLNRVLVEIGLSES